jgi:hypothetical protein
MYMDYKRNEGWFLLQYLITSNVSYIAIPMAIGEVCTYVVHQVASTTDDRAQS